MNKKYKIQLPKGKAVVTAKINVDNDNGVMTIDVDFTSKYANTSYAKLFDSNDADRLRDGMMGKYEQKYEPKDGDFIVYDDNYGINISIYKGEYAIGHRLYCFYNDKKGLYDKGWNVKTFDFPCRPATEEEKKLLIDKLAEVGKRWNPATKTIDDVRWRAKKYEPYYYIIALENIIGTIDEGLACDDSRYESNNYFKTREAAEEASAQIREVLKKSKTE